MCFLHKIQFIVFRRNCTFRKLELIWCFWPLTHSNFQLIWILNVDFLRSFYLFIFVLERNHRKFFVEEYLRIKLGWMLDASPSIISNICSLILFNFTFFPKNFLKCSEYRLYHVLKTWLPLVQHFLQNPSNQAILHIRDVRDNHHAQGLLANLEREINSIKWRLLKIVVIMIAI